MYFYDYYDDVYVNAQHLLLYNVLCMTKRLTEIYKENLLSVAFHNSLLYRESEVSMNWHFRHKIMI